MRRNNKVYAFSSALIALLQTTQCPVHSQDPGDKDSSPADQLMGSSISATINDEVEGPIEFSCDFNNDPCPSQFNRKCEADTPDGCPANTDCFDCDPCHQFHLDCQGCVEHGCFYCPTDAFCTSMALETPVWKRIEFLFKTTIAPTCVTADDYVSQCSAMTTDNVFPDPLYDAMHWAYELLNVESVWKRGIQGTGVRIRINDNGVDYRHPEFEERFDVDASCNADIPRGNHGTAVASLAAGGANDHCAVGIAPNASLSSCAMTLQASIHPDLLADMMSAKLEEFDISINAWGMATCLPMVPQRRLQPQINAQQNCPFRLDHEYSPCHFCDFDASPNTPSSRNCLSSIIYYCAMRYEKDVDACSDYLDLFTMCSYNALTPAQEQALAKGVYEGRNGKGAVYVFSAGNSHNLGVDTNFDGWVNSRYTISVGAVGKDGKHASYSTTGAALLVSGPGGDRESLTNNIVAVAGSNGRCGDMTVGTSFSAPYVAGVIALMLEVNPELTWRDIQGILAQTSTQVDEEGAWTNAAGFKHSYKVGFGIPNAEAAVNAAETWQVRGSEQEIRANSGVVDLAIADDATAITTSVISLNDTVAASMVVETVVVNVSLAHGSRGDLSIVLTSPEGTKSILHPGKRPENTAMAEDERWKLMTVRNWGESPMGDWSLSLVDENLGVLDSCVDLPFEYTFEDDDGQFILTCQLLELMEACTQGYVVPAFGAVLGDSRTPAEGACCSCGGGKPATLNSRLRSWELVVYGHERISEQPSTSPTSAPTIRAPTMPPSLSENLADTGRDFDTSPEYLEANSGAPSFYVASFAAALTWVIFYLW